MTAGSGSELTREQVVGLLVEPLMAQSVVLAAGPRMFETSGGAVVNIANALRDAMVRRVALNRYRRRTA